MYNYISYIHIYIYCTYIYIYLHIYIHTSGWPCHADKNGMPGFRILEIGEQWSHFSKKDAGCGRGTAQGAGPAGRFPPLLGWNGWLELGYIVMCIVMTLSIQLGEV